MDKGLREQLLDACFERYDPEIGAFSFWSEFPHAVLLDGGVRLDADEADRAGQRLASLTNLKLIDFSWLQWDADVIGAIAPRLAGLAQLETLSMNRCGLGGASALAMARMIAGIGCLKSLGFGLNRLGEDAASFETLLSAIGTLGKRLERLDLSGNRLGDEHAQPIRRELAGLQSLTHLYLSRNRISVAALAPFIAARTKLKALEISYMALIGDIEDVAACLARLEHLEFLDLRHDKLGDVDLKALTPVLATRPKLAGLVLSYNGLSDAGAVVDLLEKWLASRQERRSAYCFLDGNRLRWSGKHVSNETLDTTNADDLLKLLRALRSASAELPLASAAFIGRTEHGKTHVCRWLAAQAPEEEAALRLPINDRTIGYHARTLHLPRTTHGREGLGDLHLTLVDVGGHREQLSAAANLLYVRGTRTVFILVIKGGDITTLGGTDSEVSSAIENSFVLDNWGRYYLKLICVLRAHLENIVNPPGELLESRVTVASLAKLNRQRPPAEQLRIPVVILVSHTTQEKPSRIPPADFLRAQLGDAYDLLDIVAVQPWEAPQGDQYRPALWAAIGAQLGKLKELGALTVPFIRRVMEAVEEKFGLVASAPVDFPPDRCSMSVAEFRQLCGEGTPREQQDAAIRELAACGYLAFLGRTEDLAPDSRLLNPRFVNFFLFGRILNPNVNRRIVEANGFLSARSRSEQLNQISEQGDRLAIDRLLEQCLVTFPIRAGGVEGVFIPDATAFREEVKNPLPWDDIQCRGTFKPRGFLGESSFFELLANQHKTGHLRHTHALSGAGRSGEIPSTFRNACVLGSGTDNLNDQCNAWLFADVIREMVYIEVRGPNFRDAEIFGDHVLLALGDWCLRRIPQSTKFEGDWEMPAFERLWQYLNSRVDNKTTYAEKIMRELAAFTDKGARRAFTVGDLGQLVVERKHRGALDLTNKEKIDKVRPAVDLLHEKRVLEKRNAGKKSGFMLTEDVGLPFIAWLSKKLSSGLTP